MNLSVRDFKLLTPIEIISAQKAKMDLWHLQNVVNANFFVPIHQSLGVKLKNGNPIERKHLYLLPGEEVEEIDFDDVSTPEAREKFNARVKAIHDNGNI